MGILKKFTILFLSIIINSTNSFPQIKFDVKTPIEEKGQIRVVKAAVIASLNETNWAKVVEYGENYSLWLSQLSRTSSKNKVMSFVQIELRSPAFLSRGKLIHTNCLMIDYDTTGIWELNVKDSSISNIVSQEIIETGIEQELSSYFLSMVPIPFADQILKPFIAQVFNELKRQPTPIERIEATLIAAKVLIHLREIL